MKTHFDTNKFKILVIGDVCTDVYVFGKCERLSQESPVPILKVSKKEIPPDSNEELFRCQEAPGEAAIVKIVRTRKMFGHMLKPCSFFSCLYCCPFLF